MKLAIKTRSSTKAYFHILFLLFWVCIPRVNRKKAVMFILLFNRAVGCEAEREKLV